jgi:uncharacterized membrane protein YfcA
MLSSVEFVLVGLSAVAGGAANALAGGGTLITFPTLLAVGVPAVSANVTNTVALCQGYLGATLAQAGDIRTQTRRLWLTLPVAVVGGVIGGLLLLHTGDKVFRTLVPFLILLASGLLAMQDRLKALVFGRSGARRAAAAETWAVLPIALAAVYGGYFGAGLSVIVLAVLGLLMDDTLTRLNALKQAIALATNVAAAVFFVFSGRVNWPVAAVMAVGALVGGVAGGRLAGRVRPATLRFVVVTIGIAAGVTYLLRP